MKYINTLKKIFATTIAITGFSVASLAQITLDLGDEIYCNIGDSVTIPVNVTGFSNIGSVSLKINYDNTKLSFGRTLNWDSNFTGAVEGNNNSTGVISESWILSSSAVTISDGKLFDIKFSALGGVSAVDFSSVIGEVEITDMLGNPYTIISKTGGVAGQGEPSVTISGNTSFCAGGTTTLNAGLFATYLWSNSETTATIDAAVAGDYSVFVTDSNGCSATSPTIIVTETLELNPSISGILHTCDTLTTSLSTGNYASYLWSTGDTTNSVTVPAGSYSVSVTDVNGCVGVSDNVVIVSYSLPVPQIYGGNTTCGDTDIQLCTDTIYTNYYWDTDDGGWGTQACTAYNGSYNPINVTVTDTNGCVGTSSNLYVNQLPVEPPTNQSFSECEGYSVSVSLNIYSTTGVYYDTLSSLNGCDSVIITSLTINPTYAITTDKQICTGTSFTFNGISHDSTGVYTYSLTSSLGCDSIEILNLTVVDTITSNLSAEICQGQTYSFGTQTLSTTGIYTEFTTSVGGCDSLTTLSLTVNAIDSAGFNQNICNGSSYTFNGITFAADTVYTANYIQDNGCDSLVTLVLTVLPTFTQNVSAAICDNNAYIFGGQSYNTAGIYYHTFTAVNGCDSIVEFTLYVYATHTDTQYVSICEGQTYSFGGNDYSTFGTYSYTTQNQSNCDSTTYLVLTVNPTFANTIIKQICNGNSYDLGGTSYSSTGIYSHTFTSILGCDSIITLDLIVVDTITYNMSATICEGNTYSFGTQTLSATGLYFEYGTSAGGCDSLTTLALTVNTLPVLDFSFAMDSVCDDGGLVVLNASPIGGTFSGMGVSVTDLDPSGFAVAGYTSITYAYTDINGCSSSVLDSIFIDICSGINNSILSHVSIYPNPTSGIITVRSNTNIVIPISVMNAIGQTIYTNSFTTKSTIDLSKEATGIYTIKVGDGEKAVYQKMVKQ